jgi:putative oxidoreductase
MRHSKLLERFLDIAGKCLIGALFWWSGFDGLFNFGDVVSYVQTRPLPFPQLVAAASVALEILVPVALFVRRLEPWAALILAVYCLLTALLFHNYWAVEGADRYEQEVNFFKNLTMAGGLLIVIARDLAAMRLAAREGWAKLDKNPQQPGGRATVS